MKLKKMFLVFATTMLLSQNIQAGELLNTDDIRVLSGVTSKEMRMVVPETMKDIVNDIVYYSNQYGINEYIFTAIIRLESGNNTSKYAVERNNLGGIKINGKYHYFNNKTECIEYMARLLSNQYLSEDGKYYNGTSISDVCIKYNGTDEWTSQVQSIANKMYKDIEGR